MERVARRLKTSKAAPLSTPAEAAEEGSAAFSP